MPCILLTLRAFCVSEITFVLLIDFIYFFLSFLHLGLSSYLEINLRRTLEAHSHFDFPVLHFIPASERLPEL